MRKKLNHLQEKMLCREYQSGMTPLQLSIKYEIATNTIWHYLVRNNIERNIRPAKKKE